MALDINGSRVPALVDTSASMSLIEDLVSTQIKELNSVVFLQTAGRGDGGMVAKYHTDQNFSLGEYNYSVRFLVVPSLELTGVKIILGIDAITALKAVVDCRSGEPKIIINHQSLPILGDVASTMISSIGEGKRERPISAYCGEDIFVPANSCTDITLDLGSIVKDGIPVLITPVEEFHGILAPEAISTVKNNCVQVRFNNPSNSIFKLPRSTHLAHIESDIQVYPISPVELSRDKERESKLRETAKGLAPPQFQQAVADIVCSYSDVFAMSDERTGYCETLPFTWTKEGQVKRINL